MAAITPEDAWILADEVGHAHALFTSHLEEVVRLDGLTMTEAIALWIVDQSKEGVTQTEWGRLQGVSRQRAHVIAKSLERLGYVSIERGGRDSLVTICKPGQEFVVRSKKKIGRVLVEALDGMTHEEAKQTTGLLRRIISLLTSNVIQ